MADRDVDANAVAHQFCPAPRAPLAEGSKLPPQADVVCDLPTHSPPPTHVALPASAAGAAVFPPNSLRVEAQATQPARAGGSRMDAACAAGAVAPSLANVASVAVESGKPVGSATTHSNSGNGATPLGDGRSAAVPAQYDSKVVAATPSLAAAASVGVSAPAHAVASSTPVPAAAKPQELRLRFFNYNMANNADFEVPGQPGLGLASLQGPGGRGHFEAASAALADGQPVDLVFAAFVETHLTIQDWVEQYKSSGATVLDEAVVQNALNESMQDFEHAKIRGLMEQAAARYNGNLKTLLLYSTKTFAEDPEASLFGRLVEKKVAGLAVPNPKKAFAGRSMRARGEGIRFCLTGAHFPVSNLAAALEDPEKPLEAAKAVLARTLRRVLRKAAQKGILDDMTVLVLQGDLNSRTVLHGGRTMDVLLEVIRDERIQTAMRQGLSIPQGHWREVAEHSEASSLPVTYKFADELGTAFSHRKAGESNGIALPTIGDIVSAGGGASTADQDPSEIYRSILQRLPTARLQAWGLDFKENSFRPFRFPSAADRVIYWAPDSLGDRMSWTFPRGPGYEVNHFQSGSDHRPVSLEVVLRIARATDAAGSSSAVARSPPIAVPMRLVQEICQDDSEGDDGEWMQSDLASVGHAVSTLAGAAGSAAHEIHQRVRASSFFGNLQQAITNRGRSGSQ